jgi:hypothetical protein
VLRAFIALKNLSPQPGLKTRTLDTTASTLTITPPRQLEHLSGPFVFEI